MPWVKSASDRQRDAQVYGPQYRANRAKARRRAGGRCEGCGHKHPRLQCDHRRNTGDGAPDHSLGNLQMLCCGEGSCKCHEKKTATEGGGWRSKRGKGDPAPRPREQW